MMKKSKGLLVFALTLVVALVPMTGFAQNSPKSENDIEVIGSSAQILGAASDFVVDDDELVRYRGPGGKVVIPERVNGRVIREIDSRAFSFSGNKITSITIPATVTDVDDIYAGSNLSAITVVAGNRWYSSSGGVLYNKNKSVIISYPTAKKGNSFTVPSSVREIDSGAFKNCINLTSIKIGSSVREIGSSAFYGCSKLQSIAIPNSVVEFDLDYTFAGCKSLKSVTLPQSIRDDDEATGVFYGCTALEKVTLPEGIRELEGRNFTNCKALKEIVLPRSLRTVNWDEFANLKSLQKITFKGNAPANRYQELSFRGTPNVKVFYNKGATGFTTPKWKGVPCYQVGSAQDKPTTPLPNVNNIKLNTSIANGTPGGKLVSRAVVTGNTAGLQYKFVWSYNNWEYWDVISDFSSDNLVDFSPPWQGKYDIIVDVKDKNGNVVSKSNRVDINLNRGSSMTVSTRNTNVGTPITITAKSTGVKPQYKFVWTRNNWNRGNWGVLRNFSTNKKFVFTPPRAGRYEFIVDVKDAYGNITSKKQIVNVK